MYIRVGVSEREGDVALLPPDTQDHMRETRFASSLYDFIRREDIKRTTAIRKDEVVPRMARDT